MMKPLPMVFKRDQVERSIAATTRRISNAQDRPDAGLKADMKRLLDVDRAMGVPTRKGPLSRYAFFDAPPPGRGIDLTYSFECTFALLVAERLLNGGLTQLRAVTRLRTIRPKLDVKVGEILAHQVPDIQRGLQPRPSREHMVFLITPGGRAADLELEKIVFCSVSDVADSLVDFANLREPVIALELVNLVGLLRHALERIPVRKRGRS
jgi:hypothetical protein